MSKITNNTLFEVLAPLGMTTTDTTGAEHDHEPGVILTFADFNTSVRHLHTLIRIKDLAIHDPTKPRVTVPDAPPVDDPTPDPDDQDAFDHALWGDAQETDHADVSAG